MGDSKRQEYVHDVITVYLLHVYVQQCIKNALYQEFIVQVKETVSNWNASRKITELSDTLSLLTLSN